MIDWSAVLDDLNSNGVTTTGPFLDLATCATLSRLYDDDEAFRSHVIMRRHGFGEGEYKYLSYPLPKPVTRLRAEVYPRLVPLANAWMERLKSDIRYPDTHAAVHRARRWPPAE